VWLAGEGWDSDRKVWGVVIASVVLDFVLAGSEIFHRIRLHQKRKEAAEEPETVEMEKLNVTEQKDLVTEPQPISYVVSEKK